MKAEYELNTGYLKTKSKRSKKRRFLIVLAFSLLVIFTVLGWYIVPLMLAKPTIKVDYVAEFNRITKPQDYDPELNAAPHYEKLFSELTSLPADLTDEFRAWPTDLSLSQIDTLKKWGTANKYAIKAMSEGAKCRYWWSEATSSDGSMPGVQLQYGNKQRELTWGVVLLAKYQASQGASDEALQLLADLHMMGIHRSRRNTIVEQMVGLSICELGYQAVVDILSRCDVNPDAIDRMRQILSSPTSQLNIPKFTRGEFLHAMDTFQRAFTDDGKQSGRLIPRELYRIKHEGGLFSEPLSYTAAVWICLTHPDRKETLEAYHLLNKTFNELAEKSPCELHAQLTTYVDELWPLVERNYFLRDGVPAFAGVIETCWRGKAHGDAVDIILAILTYQAEKGKLTVSLDELVEVGYLNSVPTDPYSGKPFVYKVVDDGFILYSVGADFSDNGGVARSWTDTNDGGDRVFWPNTSALEDL